MNINNMFSLKKSERGKRQSSSSLDKINMLGVKVVHILLSISFDTCFGCTKNRLIEMGFF